MSLRFEQRSQSASQQPATAAETAGSPPSPLRGYGEGSPKRAAARAREGGR